MHRNVCRILAVVVLLGGPRGLRADNPQEKVSVLLAKKTFTDAGKVLRYRLLVPDEFDAGKKYPLVVFLHGAGERGEDNEAQLRWAVADLTSPDNRKKYPCFLVAPQCPTNQKWVEVDWSAPSHDQPADPSEPGGLVLKLIGALGKEYPIDPRRIYLTGLSMGGYGTWDLLARRPELFAAGVPVCGGGDEKQAAVLARIPIWAFHGARDESVPVRRSRNMVEAIRKAGGQPRYTEYPDVAHASWVPAYKDPELLRWLFAQKKE